METKNVMFQLMVDGLASEEQADQLLAEILNVVEQHNCTAAGGYYIEENGDGEEE